MIELRAIHKWFHRGDGHEVHALRGIHLGVVQGEVVTIIGSNGAGKSTLLNTIAFGERSSYAE
jgi:putative ABC transport system ATP-binding protein